MIQNCGVLPFFIKHEKFTVTAQDRPFRGYCDFCPVLVYEFPYRQYCLAPAMNRASHVPAIKTRRFRPYAISLFPTITIRSQNIHIYHCAAYHCYSVYASLRFGPCCPTECGDWENVRIQIGVDVRDFDACISYRLSRYSRIQIQ